VADLEASTKEAHEGYIRRTVRPVLGEVKIRKLGAVKMSQPAGRNAAHCPGWPLQRRGHPEIVSNRFAETISGTRP
jgi:hypothetical protein